MNNQDRLAAYKRIGERQRGENPVLPVEDTGEPVPESRDTDDTQPASEIINAQRAEETAFGVPEPEDQTEGVDDLDERAAQSSSPTLNDRLARIESFLAKQQERTEIPAAPEPEPEAQPIDRAALRRRLAESATLADQEAYERTLEEYEAALQQQMRADMQHVSAEQRQQDAMRNANELFVREFADLAGDQFLSTIATQHFQQSLQQGTAPEQAARLAGEQTRKWLSDRQAAAVKSDGRNELAKRREQKREAVPQPATARSNTAPPAPPTADDHIARMKQRRMQA